MCLLPLLRRHLHLLSLLPLLLPLSLLCLLPLLRRHLHLLLHLRWWHPVHPIGCRHGLLWRHMCHVLLHLLHAAGTSHARRGILHPPARDREEDARRQ